MENKKIEWLQLYRGLIITFVVFGHIIWFKNKPSIYIIIHDIIYLFHMPAFFFFFFFLFGLKECSNNITYTIKKKLITLGIPYLFFSTIYLLFKLFLQNFIRFEAQVSITDFFRIFFFPNVGTSVYWFLFVLILYFIIFSFSKNYNWIIFGITITSIIFFFLWKTNKYHFYNDCFELFAGYAFSFSIPLLIGKQFNNINWNNPLFKFFLFLFSIFFIIFAVPFVQGYKYSGTLLNSFINFSLLIGGCCFTGLLNLLIQKIAFLKKGFIFIGNYSWYIYLIHSYFLNVTRNFLARLSLIDINPILYVLINILIGIFGSIFIGIVSRKFFIIDYWFYPAKYIYNRKKDN